MAVDGSVALVVPEDGISMSKTGKSVAESAFTCSIGSKQPLPGISGGKK
jgi:hypothetical protein